MLEYISKLRQSIEKLSKTAGIYDEKLKQKLFFSIHRAMINNGIKDELMKYNCKELMDSYISYFQQKEIYTISFRQGTKFYRARIGTKELEVKFPQNSDSIFIDIPYYDKDIAQVPPLLALGGRFNRAGVSNLYLANTPETALIEVHSQVGQKVSVAEFELIQDTTFLDLTQDYNDTEMEIWKRILTQPIHDEIKRNYLITQFLSEVLQQINSSGFFFKSTQTNGYNIVCFKPNLFKEIKFSEIIFEIKSISYQYEPYIDKINQLCYLKEDEVDKFITKAENTNLNDYRYFQDAIRIKRNNMDKKS